MDVFSIVGKITVDYADALDDVEKVTKTAKDAAESLDDVDENAKDAGDSVKKSGDAAKKADSGFSTWKATLANLYSQAISKLISGCEQLASKMVDLTKTAVGNYADYEQLLGGAELMFGDAYDYIVEKAENAYKTVQLSQNDYLEQVNGFAVGLKTALGGNEQAAAELADRIVTAEADIVAATGNTQENVQNAFNGIMKSNYTMLENLQIGITSTKEGFQEVIDKVNEWKAANGEAADYTIDNLADCQNALIDYIEIQGLSGYAAGEASTTIQGSWSSVKALFDNILTKVGEELAPTIMDLLNDLSDWMNSVDWDAFADSIGDSFQSIFDWIEAIDIKAFFEKGMDGIEKFIEKLGDLIEDMPEIIQTFKDWSPLIAGVTAGFVTLKAAMAISSLISVITTAWTAYKTASEGATIAQWLFNGALGASPIVLIVTLIAGLVAALITLWNTNDGFREAVASAWEFVKGAVSTAIEAIKWLFTGLVDSIKQAWELIKNAVSTALDAISTTIRNIWNAIVGFLTPILEGIKNTFVTIWGAIKTAVSTAINAIRTVITTVWNAIKTTITNVINSIKSTVSSAFNAIKSTISSILNSIKSAFTSVWNGIKSTVSNVINGVKSTISNGLNAAKSVVSNVLGTIKDKFSSIFDGAKNIVSNAINKIKGFFKFSWSLPKIKLPHFTISGSFSLSPPRIPHISVEWYKKAMEDGMIMNQPTIFGYNAKSNQFLAGGEAGSETVVGTSSLMTMIKAAVGDENAALLERFDSVLRLLESYLPVIPEISHMQLVTDTGALVGELAPEMNKELGRIYEREGRW